MTGTLTHIKPTMATVRTDKGDRILRIAPAAARWLRLGARVRVPETGLSGRFLRVARPGAK